MNQLVIFDIDGTLSDTVELDDSVAIDTFRTLFKLNIDTKEWEESKILTSGTDLGTFNYFYPKIATRVSYKSCLKMFKEKFIESLNYKIEISKNKVIEITGANNFLKILDEHNNFDIAFATGSFLESGILKTKSVGIDITKYAYANSDNFTNRKDIVKYAIQQSIMKYGRSYDKITYFGDGLWDYKAANELGINFIKIGNNPNFNVDLDIFSFADYLDNEKILEHLNKY